MTTGVTSGAGTTYPAGEPEFTLVFNAAKEGWKCNHEPPPRKDFALFVKIQTIGSNNGFTEKCSSKSGKVLLFIICGLQSVPKPTSVKASEKLYKICFLIK
jgi:hypothetical protein